MVSILLILLVQSLFCLSNNSLISFAETANCFDRLRVMKKLSYNINQHYFMAAICDSLDMKLVTYTLENEKCLEKCMYFFCFVVLFTLYSYVLVLFVCLGIKVKIQYVLAD